MAGIITSWKYMVESWNMRPKVYTAHLVYISPPNLCKDYNFTRIIFWSIYHSVWFATYNPVLLATPNYKHFANFVAITSGFLYTYLIMFTPQMFLESLWSCAPPPIVVSFLQWGVNFIKYVQRNPEVSSIKSFVGIQLHPNWLNACNLRFASNVGLSYNVGP